MVTKFFVLAIVGLLLVAAKPPKRMDGIKGKGVKGPMRGDDHSHKDHKRGPPMCKPAPSMPDGCDPPLGIPEPKMPIVNNGIGPADEGIEAMKSELLTKLNEMVTETECDTSFEEEILDVKMRGPQVTMKVTCQGQTDPYYASFKVNTHSPNVLDEKPEKNDLMGGYKVACKLGQMANHFLAFAKEEKPDTECEIQYPYCLQKVVNGMTYFCPVECGGETINMELVPLSETTIEVTEVLKEPSSNCFKKTTDEYLNNIVMGSTDNTFVFLENHCNFTGGKEALKVGEGNFVDLQTGTQHCIRVYTDEFGENDQSTVLAVYQFDMEGTEPILVAHPFPGDLGMAYCIGFMLTVHDIWQAA